MYFATFAISEVSLHMHIMLMILISNKLSIDAVKIQYNKPHMLKERLKRLIDLGQVREEDNFYYLNGRLLLYGSKIFDIWKILLGFPIKLIVPLPVKKFLLYKRRFKLTKHHGLGNLQGLP